MRVPLHWLAEYCDAGLDPRELGFERVQLEHDATALRLERVVLAPEPEGLPSRLGVLVGVCARGPEEGGNRREDGGHDAGSPSRSRSHGAGR